MPQDKASAQEAAERREEARTSGRTGCKMKRINLAFTDSNYEFVRVMSKIYGQTMTQFVNTCIREYRTLHPEVYEEAQKIVDAFKQDKEAE